MSGLGVVIPAAGLSSRFGRDKLAAILGGRSVLRRTLEAFAARSDVAAIVLAGPVRVPDDELLNGDASGRLLRCEGGDCRARSVLRALERVPASIEWVAVHDAARPLVSQALIDAVVRAARAHGAAAPALPVELTIKQAASPLPAPVQRTVPRAGLFALQTPQVARRADLLDALRRCRMPLEQVTDEMQALELAGREVWLVPGDPTNLKLTTPVDLLVAEALLRAAESAWARPAPPAAR